jgi:hypothetical protein
MAYLKELEYQSEQDFTHRFVLPLLNRLGYAVVINYHGSTEFGKDVVVGDFDRFSHLRYHAIQIKYLPSISLNDAEDLIRDCNQAFRNPFRHPQTGESHLISSFYAINGGSISDQAATHFFATTRSSFGDNAHLLDGKALLQLDRFATLVGVTGLRSTLLGMRVEALFNQEVASYIPEALRRMMEENGGYPLQRLRVEAVASLLERPPVGLLPNVALFQDYWQSVTMFNRAVDSIDRPLLGADYVNVRTAAVSRLRDKICGTTPTLLAVIESHLAKLGPVAGI